MKISDIDKEFISVINSLNNEGFRPFASCDGVLSSHNNPKDVGLAYISFLESEGILDLFATLNRDKETFNLLIDNNYIKDPYEIYGNLIEGNKYSIHFENKYNERTEYFEKIVNALIEKKINVKEEKEIFEEIQSFFNENANTDISYTFDLNCNYQPYMQKEGKINKLGIDTKTGYDYERNFTDVISYLNKKLGLDIVSNDKFINENNNIPDEFIKDNESNTQIDRKSVV